ncbi:MAG: hypothetical protein WBE89_13565, partial [Methyloceanibacter sp.]
SRARAKCGQRCFTIEVCDVKGLAVFLVQQGCLTSHSTDPEELRLALQKYVNDHLPCFDYSWEEEEVPIDLYQ